MELLNQRFHKFNMNIIKDYNLRFEYRKEDNILAVHSEKEQSILAHFLMHWNSPTEIVAELLPLVNRGIQYGTIENWKTKDGWSGYYIEGGDMFLESIDADVVGSVFVMSDKTKLDCSEIGLVDLELSSIDFKEIIIQWLCFILRNKP